MLSRKKRHMKRTASSGDKILISRPWIGTDNGPSTALHKGLESLVDSMPDTVVRTPKGVLIRVDHDEAADLLDSLPISVSEVSKTRTFKQYQDDWKDDFEHLELTW